MVVVSKICRCFHILDNADILLVFAGGSRTVISFYNVRVYSDHFFRYKEVSLYKMWVLFHLANNIANNPLHFKTSSLVYFKTPLVPLKN